MARVIIGIHGLAAKPPKAVLKDWWKRSIVEGLRRNEGLPKPRLRFELVYWADLMHRHPLHLDADFTLDDLYNREPYLPARPGALKPYMDGRFDRIRANVREVALRGVEGLKDGLGLGSLTDALLWRTARDLTHYWNDETRIRGRDGRRGVVRNVLDAECRRSLQACRGLEIMVIAHSMGSIIAYNVLRALGRGRVDLEVARYVTVGSPLGLSTVKDRIRRTHWDREVRTPSIVTGQWVNLADKGDPIAFDSHLADDYGPNPLGVQVRDDLVLNDYEAGGKANCHKIYGYLRTPEMSNLIAGFLRGE